MFYTVMNWRLSLKDEGLQTRRQEKPEWKAEKFKAVQGFGAGGKTWYLY